MSRCWARLEDAGSFESHHGEETEAGCPPPGQVPDAVVSTSARPSGWLCLQSFLCSLPLVPASFSSSCFPVSIPILSATFRPTGPPKKMSIASAALEVTEDLPAVCGVAVVPDPTWNKGFVASDGVLRAGAHSEISLPLSVTPSRFTSVTYLCRVHRQEGNLTVSRRN